MKQLYVISWILLTIVSILSCGQRDSTRVIPQSFNDAQVHQLLIDHRTVGSFKDEKGIPIGVGLVDIVKGLNPETQKLVVSNCAGTLIEGGDVATAAHCVTKDVREGKESCNTLVFKHELLRENYPCKKIEWYSQQYKAADGVAGPDLKNYAPDVVIFSLKKIPTGLTKLRLSEKPLHTGVAYTGWTYVKQVDPDSLVSTFHFAKLGDCSLYNDDFAPTGFPFRALSCLVSHGDSGSPILLDNQHIQAIVSTDLKSGGKSVGLIATDLSCLKKVAGKYIWQSNCPETGALYLR